MFVGSLDEFLWMIFIYPLRGLSSTVVHHSKKTVELFSDQFQTYYYNTCLIPILSHLCQASCCVFQNFYKSAILLSYKYPQGK